MNSPLSKSVSAPTVDCTMSTLNRALAELQSTRLFKDILEVDLKPDEPSDLAGLILTSGRHVQRAIIVRNRYCGEFGFILVGDCEQILNDFHPTSDGVVQIVLTDPPYGIGIAREWDFEKLNIPGLADQLDHLIAPKGSLVAFCGMEQLSPWAVALQARGYRTYPFTWNKTNPSPKGGVVLTSFEMAVFSHHRGAWFNRDFVRRNHIYLPTNTRAAKILGHPCYKPQALGEYILYLTKPGLVFDPYLGTGAFGAAALALGRPVVGIERSLAYAMKAAQRMRDAVPELDKTKYMTKKALERFRNEKLKAAA